MTPMLCMSAGWGDAAILVPYALYKRTGDRKILADNYEMMQRWYGFLLGRAQQTTDEQQGGDYAKFTVLNGMDYGEWCEPGITPMQAMMKPTMITGTTVMRKPMPTHIKPSGRTTVSKNCPPADKPKEIFSNSTKSPNDLVKFST